MREERKERRGSEKKREENKSESGEGEKRMECARERRESRGPLSSLSLSFSPSLSSRSAVIYRPEPSPSLTPLLRNYTQSVANKSKKVLAVLVRIHETCAVPSAPRPILPLLLSRPPPPSTTLSPLPRLRGLHVVKPANLRSQFDRDSGPDSQATDRSHPRATKRTLHFSAYFRPIPSPDTLLPSFRGRRYMEVYSFFLFLPLLECKRG